MTEITLKSIPGAIIYYLLFSSSLRQENPDTILHCHFYEQSYEFNMRQNTLGGTSILRKTLNFGIMLQNLLTFGGSPNLWNFLPISGKRSATLRLVFDLARSIAL